MPFAGTRLPLEDTQVTTLELSLCPHVKLTLKSCHPAFAADCDHVIPDNIVISSKHCSLLQHVNGSPCVLDTSKNGTFVNGKKIGRGQQQALRAGDEVAISLDRAEGRHLVYAFHPKSQCVR